MRTPARILPVLATLALAGVGCPKDDKSGDSAAPACSGAVAVAGVDLAGAPGALVTLDGSGSTVCDADSIAYLWSIESVPVDSAVDNGDLIILTIGEPIGKAARTNTLKLIKVGEFPRPDEPDAVPK